MSNNVESNIFHNKYYILGLFSLLPVLNFVAFNIGESGFSLSRAVFYVLVISVTAFLIYLFLKILFPRFSNGFIALFIGLSIFVTSAVS